MSDTTTLISHFYLKLDGKEPPAELTNALESISVESSLHLPDVATITLHDPHLHWVDNDALAPGKAVQVSARAGRGEKLLFDGEIVEIEPDYGQATQRLVVRAFDRLHRLGRGRSVRSFQNVNDGDLITKLAREVGLQAKVGPTSQVYPYVLQTNETNLTFLQARAAALGYLLFVRGKTLHCEAPSGQGQAIPLQWGAQLSDFRPRLSTLGQVSSVTARGWDPAQRREVVGRSKPSPIGPKIGNGKRGGQVAREAFGIEAQHLVADRPIRTQAVAEQLAQAFADQSEGRFIEAEGTCSGNPALVAGASVQISAVGTRFSGTYFVTSATHHYNTGQSYTTSFTISGLHPATLLATLAPAQQVNVASGLVIAIVTDNQDPEGLGRVKVKYPWLSSEHASDWARVVSVGGGAQRGIEFLPEVNDEVLVGFELEDIHYPYVLGGLWNGKDAPPKSSAQVVQGGKVQQRIIRSRAGHTIILDDSDDGSGVTIQDKSGNVIKLDSKANTLSIAIKGNATLESQGNLSLKSQGSLTLEAQGQLQVKGMGVAVDGGAATVDVKGSVINLN